MTSISRLHPIYGRSYRPPEILSATEWAMENIIVNKGPMRGQPWKPARGYEYQKLIIEQAFGPPEPGEEERTFVARKGARVGFTLCMMIGLIYTAAYRRTASALVMPRKPDSSEKSAEISDIIKAAPKLRALFAKTQGPIKKTKLGVEIINKSTQSERELISWGAGVIAVDENDRHGPLEYDHLGMLWERMGEYNRKIMCLLGTPILPDDGIDYEFQQSNQQFYHARCPFCNEFQILDWEKNIRFERKGSIEDQVQSSRYICQKCEKSWTRRARERANELGEWVAAERSVKKKGVHISRLYVPAANSGEFVKSYLEGQRDGPRKQREFWNQKLGLGFLSKAGKPQKAILEKLITSKVKWGELPPGCNLVVGGADVQGSAPPYEFVIEIRAYRPDGYCFLIWYDRVRGYEKAAEIFNQRYGKRPVSHAIVDSSDGHHRAAVERLYFKCRPVSAAKFDAKNEVTFRRAALIESELGFDGYLVNQNWVLEDNMSRLFPNDDGETRISIARNPHRAREEEWINEYHSMNRVPVEVGDRDIWIYRKPKHQACDYPFAGALAELALVALKDVGQMQQAEERYKARQSKPKTQGKSQQDANVAKAQQRRRWK